MNSSITPIVSIIIPNYNHALFLKERLESVFSQTFQNFEVILLDDCSTDNSLEIIHEYALHPKVTHFIVNEKNSGSSFKQWKKGIDLAKGKFIWIAESDDVADINFLKETLNPFFKDKNCVLSYCRSFNIDKYSKIVDGSTFWPDGMDINRWKESYNNLGLDEVRSFLVYRNTIPNASSCVFSKDCAKLSEDILSMKFAGDWLFWGRLLMLGSVYFNEKNLNMFRSHPNMSRASKNFNFELSRFKEYSFVILTLRKLSGLGSIKRREMKEYDWIIWQMNHVILSRNIFNPKLMSINLLFWMYFIIKRIKKIISAKKIFCI
jgi:glycosyltransferase involved in cell wall biosynthesis